MTTRFVDEYAPDKMPSYPCVSAPRWSTQLVAVDSGDEQANQRWAHPLWRFNLPQGVRDHATFAAVRDHWLAMRGPFHTWPFRDPFDFASRELTNANVEPQITPTDQLLGTGDGTTTTFQLRKAYTRGTQTYWRAIHVPIVATVRVAIAGVEQAGSPTTWEVSRPGGVVTFSTAPTAGAAVTAGFFFDVAVRFDGDDVFEAILRNYFASGFADIPLTEVRYCED